MKKLILFLVIFGAFLAHAQEMDTTYVVNEQGQTVGIIHEKGTIPVVAKPQQYPVQQQYPAQPNPAFAFDSTLYYQSLIDRYSTSGNRFRRVGNGMMIGGGIGAGFGLFLFIVGMSQIDYCDDYSYNDDGCDNDEGVLAALSGYILMIGGVTVFTVGVPLKIVGGAKLRRADRYHDILLKYQMRRQYSLKLRAAPMIDPINNSLGGKLALDF